jgi:hypothetical protein
VRDRAKLLDPEIGMKEAAEILRSRLQSQVLNQLEFQVQQMVPATLSSKQRLDRGGRSLADYYCATVLAAFINQRFAVIMGCGDGGYVLNGRVVRIDGGDEPPLLVRGLSAGMTDEGLRQNSLRVFRVIATAELDHLGVWSDGIHKIEDGRRCGDELAAAMIAQAARLEDVEGALLALGRSRFEIEQCKDTRQGAQWMFQSEGAIRDDASLACARRVLLDYEIQ